MQSVKNKKIAITGSIGCGKSFVSEIFRSHGLSVFDADAYNRTLYENEDILKALYVAFPSVFVDGNVNKKALASLIFNDSTKKDILESIMLPKIIEAIHQEMMKHSIFVAEVPTLFENHLEDEFDIIIVVAADQSIILKRLEERGLSHEESLTILNQQVEQGVKIEKADVVFYNNKSKQSLKEEVDKWVSENLCI
ncbi:MAG: dephospho-CoA kinase [Erysipelotrichaceae bacterium]